MPSDKHNSIMTIATGLISSLIYITLSETCLFANRSSSSNACIMVLSKLIIDFPCVPFLFPLPHRWGFAVHTLWFQCETWASTLFTYATLCLECYPKSSKQLERSVVIQHDWMTHPLLINRWACTLTIKHILCFSAMTGLIVEMIFMLLHIYNAV